MAKTKSETVVTEGVPAASESATAHSMERRIEIELPGRRRVIVDAGVDVEALRRIIAVLDQR
ncbi:hypothetical protein MTR72_24360 [Bradyrhizobium sp. ISRA442]|uniref:hypothetical protein n=1 Tax=Bradyrhizobium sp. ISRA442 TaxID=2866197 RepID=UPI00311B0B13